MTRSITNRALVAARDFAYLAAILAWSIVGFTVGVTGVALTASLLIFVVGLPVWVGFAYLMRWTTHVDRRLAGWLRGASVNAFYARPRERGFLALVKAITTDRQTWRNLRWLAVNSLAGLVLGVAALGVLAMALQYTSAPLWSWSINDPESHYGLTNLVLFTNDTLGEAFAVAGIGLLLVPIALVLARRCATAHAALAVHMLNPAPGAEFQLRSSGTDSRCGPPLRTRGAAAVAPRPALSRAKRRRALRIHASLFAGVGALLVLIWAVTARGYFWPAWPLIVFAVPLAVHVWIELLTERPQVIRAQRLTYALTVQEGVSATLLLFLIAIWALTTRAYFWPVWPLIGLAIPFAIHALVVYARADRSSG